MRLDPYQYMQLCKQKGFTEDVYRFTLEKLGVNYDSLEPALQVAAGWKISELIQNDGEITIPNGFFDRYPYYFTNLLRREDYDDMNYRFRW